MQLKSNLKMRYCPMIDSFIKIREFSTEEMEHFFQNVDISDKRSYQELVVQAAIPEYNEKALSLVQSEYDREIDVESAIDELYRMCIKVNPSLNIYNVSIPVQDKEQRAPLFRSRDKKDFLDRIQEVQGIEEALQKRVIGQVEAIAKVCRSIKSARVGIKDPNRPVGCFIFAGQTGVGKTELAKALAEFITGDEAHMVRVDCSEYSLPHEYSKLIGAPPGYVGYDDGGSLAEPLLKRPENVVLFDEIEKADPKMHNLLLQVMDEGIITDNKGRKISFQDAVVILTSNVGVEGIEEMKSAVGFTRQETFGREFVEKETLKSLEKTFRPEFLNRLDEVICFNSLDYEENLKIVQNLMARLKKNLSTMKIFFRFTKGVADFLIREGTDPRYGARPLKRAIKKYIETPLTEKVMQDPSSISKKILAKMSGNKVVFVEDKARRKQTGGGSKKKNRKRECA